MRKANMPKYDLCSFPKNEIYIFEILKKKNIDFWDIRKVDVCTCEGCLRGFTTIKNAKKAENNLMAFLMDFNTF